MQISCLIHPLFPIPCLPLLIFLHVSHECCPYAVFISPIQTNLYSIQSVFCASGNDCRTSTQYIPPPSLCGLPDLLESLSGGANAWTPLPSLRFHSAGPYAVERYPTPQRCVVLQLYCSLPGHISLITLFLLRRFVYIPSV